MRCDRGRASIPGDQEWPGGRGANGDQTVVQGMRRGTGSTPGNAGRLGPDNRPPRSKSHCSGDEPQPARATTLGPWIALCISLRYPATRLARPDVTRRCDRDCATDAEPDVSGRWPVSIKAAAKHRDTPGVPTVPPDASAPSQAVLDVPDASVRSEAVLTASDDDLSPWRYRPGNVVARAQHPVVWRTLQRPVRRGNERCALPWRRRKRGDRRGCRMEIKRLYKDAPSYR